MLTKEQRDEIMRIASRIEHASTEESEAYELANFHKYLDSITVPEGWQRVPLSEEQIYQVIEAARESYRAHTTGIRGQMLTIYDDMDWHLVRAVEQAHGIKEQSDE